jgi:glycosyltransferase involved in cell wall biosynthesis
MLFFKRNSKINAEITLFSRDKRTHDLFRSSWVRAAIDCGYDVNIFCRGFAFGNIVRSVFKFICCVRHKRVIFGTSEICLYSLFSNKKDMWVFTGLGRLLTNEGVFNYIISKILQYFYRGQILVVLNSHDQIFVEDLLGTKPHLIEGEGYNFRTCIRPYKNNYSNFTFAYVGRLLKSKGVDKLVASFAEHSPKEWSLLLFGDNDFFNSDSVNIDEMNEVILKSKGDIKIMGFRDNVRDLLVGIDFLISLSSREGLPFSILDGLNEGACLILSRVPGNLSFEGLPGVHFVEPEMLGTIFENISEKPEFFLEFDRNCRLAISELRFGHQAITASISTLLEKG